jgi:riboflavin synthase
VFTGIVERAVEVTDVRDTAGGRTIRLAHRWGDERHGESIAINGCCLTVAALQDDGIAFDVIRETLDKTNLGTLTTGDRVHVERSLRAGDRIDGHFVQGHVDARAELVDRVVSPQEWRLRVRPPGELMKFVLPKGSVSIDGVSLTVAALREEAFEVALIPTTLEKTLLGDRPVGWGFNFEADVMAKGVVHAVERMRDAS